MPGTLTPLRILLVEDHLVFRQELCIFLQSCGYDVSEAGNGTEMDALLLRHSPQIVVLDLNLPGEDGLVLARRLRQAYPAIAIVMLTARSLDHQRVAGYKNGADIYLSKPANLVELHAVIQNVGLRLGAIRASQRQQVWRLDTASCLLTTPLGNCKVLSQTETALLRLLNRQSGAPSSATKSSAELIAGLHALHSITLSEANLRVALSRLRSKIQDLEPGTASIEAQRGQGYVLAVQLTIA
jgi:DNA-binding response OmpR family regulator